MVSDLLGVGLDDGVVLDSHGGHGGAREENREREGEGAGGEWVGEQVDVVLSNQGAGRHGGSGGAAGTRGSSLARSLQRRATEEEDGDFAFSPLDPLKVIATRSSSLLRIKFEHLNIFIKFWKKFM